MPVKPGALTFAAAGPMLRSPVFFGLLHVLCLPADATPARGTHAGRRSAAATWAQAEQRCFCHAVGLLSVTNQKDVEGARGCRSGPLSFRNSRSSQASSNAVSRPSPMI